jgi:prevent-host-death family protein
MKTVTPTELRANIYKLLEEVLNTGVPLEIKKGAQKLRIVPVKKGDKLRNLIARPEIIAGDPEELVGISWENEVNLDLP